MLRAYRPLFEDPRAARLLTASAVARLAVMTFDLPLVVATEEATGSYAVAGGAVAAFAVGVAVTAPLRGRLLDRRGPRIALPLLAVPAALAVGGIPLVAAAGRAWPIVLLAAMAGLVTPGLAVAMRLEWQALLGRGDPRLEPAYALESALQVSLSIVGALASALGIATIGARATLAAGAVVLLVGALAAAALSLAAPVAGPPGVRRTSPVRIAGVTTLVAATACADIGLGTIVVGATAFADDHHASWAAGVLLALFAAGAAGGAAVAGAHPGRGDPARRLARVLLALAAGLAALAAAVNVPMLALLLLLAGAPSGIQWTIASIALDRVTPAGSDGEAFAWLSTANATGFALGGLVAGVAVELGGAPVAFLAAAASVVAAAAIVLLRARTLSPSSPDARPA